MKQTKTTNVGFVLSCAVIWALSETVSRLALFKTTLIQQSRYRADAYLLIMGSNN